ncbi:helix-turn-helix domain-containing protein [Dermatobacter hominis]|uniref:helix-turn-helix domain-containing protein n=1 Tax=Dermatobacter hominis TaxID=2884263 RepID=UPI001D12EF71|nr:hypothetical protein [Dermatobacter hominis]UDY34470.1 hypothetical protein LH044_14130 [Dermatobacter hominis]
MSGDAADPRPSALEASRHTAKAVHDVGAKFMLDLEMYADTAGLGYEGTAFYFAGRGGVLGDVDHDVVFEAFTFFPAETVQRGWESSASIEDRDAAARRFAGYAARWATANIPDGTGDLTRLAELCGAVIAAADATDAPVFAGWRALEEPDGERELVVHRMNALRELRAARHGAAVREVGLEPVDAFFIRTPYMAAIFGWPEPTSEPDEETKARWALAEELTDRAFAKDLEVLGDEELDELCQLTDELLGVVS